MEFVLGGRYRLMSQLGHGGMGEVWRGVDTQLNRAVAVKVIRLGGERGADHEELVRRFKREAESVAALNHPNVVTAHDFGFDDAMNMPFLVMELIDGRSLADEMTERISRGDGGLPLDRVLSIASDVCAGLGFAHDAGVIHRDLKPANLMTVRRTGHVKIVDFGIAHGSAMSRLTNTGKAIGTLAYMAPERFGAGDVDGRADLYALACVLFELLAGRLPFAAKDTAQLVAAHLNGTPIPLRTVRPDAPAALETLLLELLEKDPDKRLGSAEAVARRIAALRMSAPWPVPATPHDLPSAPVVALAVEPGSAPRVRSKSAVMPVRSTVIDEPARPPWHDAREQWLTGNADTAERLLVGLGRDPSPATRAAAGLVHGVVRRDAYDDLPGADALFTHVIDADLEPYASMASLHRGIVRECQDHVSAARSDYRRAARSSDHECAAYATLHLAWLLMDTGDDDAAVALLEPARRRAAVPAADYLAFALGEAYLRTGRWEKARRAFEAAARSVAGEVSGHAAYQLLLMSKQEHASSNVPIYTAAVLDTPEVAELWPFILEQARPDTARSRIDAMSGWIGWLRHTGNDAVQFINGADRTRFVQVTYDEATLIEMLCRAPGLKTMPDRLQPDEIAALADFGFVHVPVDQHDPVRGEWMALDVSEDDDAEIAGTCEWIFVDVLTTRKRFTLDVEWRFDNSELAPAPRPGVPALLP